MILLCVEGKGSPKVNKEKNGVREMESRKEYTKKLKGGERKVGVRENFTGGYASTLVFMRTPWEMYA